MKRLQKRVTIYVPEEDYNKLRAKLILKGIYSISEWVRNIIKKFLAEEV